MRWLYRLQLCSVNYNRCGSPLGEISLFSKENARLRGTCRYFQMKMRVHGWGWHFVVRKLRASEANAIIFKGSAMAAWLAGWLAGSLAGWLPACLPGWLAGWWPGWLAGWLAGWLVGWLERCQNVDTLEGKCVAPRGMSLFSKKNAR